MNCSPRLARHFIAAAVWAASATAMAAPVASSGAISGNWGGYTISEGQYEVSTGFTLDTGATVTGFDFGIWLDSGRTLSTVRWAIGTDFFGTQIASGVASTPSTVQHGTTWGWYDIYAASVAVPDVEIAAGNYYLTLSATASAGDAYWDVVAEGGGINTQQRWLGDPNGYNIDQVSYTIVGQDLAVPEPGSMALVALGLLAAATARRSARRQPR